MKRFRKTIFWLHLIAGLVAGLSIAVMCLTGTALAFEKEILAWAQRDARTVPAPAENTARLTLEQLQAKVHDAQPDFRLTSIVLQNVPRAAVAFPASARGAAPIYANPYTGEVRPSAPTAVNGFMQSMNSWHRYLNFTGEVARPRGRLINGVSNLAFAFLAFSGLYLWWPRKWRTKGLRRSIVFVRAYGKARDWNWHNVIGLYSAPVLIVLTITAIPISFQWGGRVINTLTGTPEPAAGAANGPAAPAAGAPPTAIVITPPVTGARPISQDALVAIVQKDIPAWKTMTIASPGGSGGRGGRSGTETTPQPAMVTVRTSDSWPRTVNLTLTLNPYTGEVLRRSGYADQAPAQRVRAWTRYLHTGEALGFWGQLVAGLACLGGCVLVYTGFALSWRRFFIGKPTESPPSPIS